MGNIRTILIAATVVCASALLLHAESVEGWLYSRAGVAVYLPDESQPAPSGKCETCNGTGRVGDGRVDVACQDCGGDGVLGYSPVSLEVGDVVCEDGVCRIVQGVDGQPSLGDACSVSGGCPESGVTSDGVSASDRPRPVVGLIKRVRERQPVRRVFRRFLGR